MSLSLNLLNGRISKRVSGLNLLDSGLVSFQSKVFSEIELSAGSSDTLAGIAFALRLQTCKGYGPTPNAVVGLYKDTACTIPATAAGDSIAAWKDELGTSGLIATQATSSKRPTLQFTNGKPVLTFDGVDDYLINASLVFPNGDFALSIVMLEVVNNPDNRGFFSMTPSGASDYSGTKSFVLQSGASGDAAQVDYNGDAILHAGSGQISTWSVLTLVRSGNVFSVYLDGTLQNSSASVTSATTPDAGFILGTRWLSGAPDATFATHVKIAAVVATASANRAAVVTLLKNYYGL